MEDKDFLKNGSDDKKLENISNTEDNKKATEGKKFVLNIDNEINKIPDYVADVEVKKKKNIFAKIMLAIVVLGISVSLSLGIIFAAQDVFGINKPDTNYLIEIPKNATVADIAQLLEDRGVIKSSLLFRAYYKLQGVNANFQYGTYSVNSNMSYDSIIDELEKYSSMREEVEVQFIEGSTIYQMAQKLEENGVCGAEEFVEVLNSTNFDYTFESNIGENELRVHKLEGYLFPDTYKFFVNDSPVNVAKKLLDNFNTKAIPSIEKKLESTSLTQQELMIVASIVQQEAGNTTEMKKVASVYLNRLNNPGEYARMQADPTIKYAEELKSHMDVIDRNIVDAYNTYVGLGLPPGPICNPGIEAIEAVLEPADTDYYYFCTNLSTGEFYYAKTLNQHNINVRKAGLK